MSQANDIERRLYNRLLDTAISYLPEGFKLELNDHDWADLEALYALRGQGKPDKPVINGVPVVRKAAA